MVLKQLSPFILKKDYVLFNHLQILELQDNSSTSLFVLIKKKPYLLGSPNSIMFRHLSINQDKIIFESIQLKFFKFF